jgi:hypothetical protein
MRILPTLIAAALAAPTPLLAATSTDIEAKGSAATFCNISSDGGPISMVLSANGDKLSGEGSYSLVSNGNAKVTLSAVNQTSPNGAGASTPSIVLADLVSNNSSSAAAASNNSGRKQGAINTSITENNSAKLLSAGDYALKATATCTSL